VCGVCVCGVWLWCVCVCGVCGVVCVGGVCVCVCVCGEHGVRARAAKGKLTDLDTDTSWIRNRRYVLNKNITRYFTVNMWPNKIIKHLWEKLYTYMFLTSMDDIMMGPGTVAALSKITHFVSTNVKYVSGKHSLNH
jgi:hypothetical protein